MTREISKPDSDPMTKGEREFLERHDKGEFAYTPDDRVMLDACCSRGLLTPVEGEFLMEQIDATRIRLKPIYRLTDAGTTALSWAPTADVGDPS